jgi:hypothetical protein
VITGLGFRVEGLGFRVEGVGRMVWDEQTVSSTARVAATRACAAARLCLATCASHALRASCEMSGSGFRVDELWYRV